MLTIVNKFTNWIHQFRLTAIWDRFQSVDGPHCRPLQLVLLLEFLLHRISTYLRGQGGPKGFYESFKAWKWLVLSLFHFECLFRQHIWHGKLTRNRHCYKLHISFDFIDGICFKMLSHQKRFSVSVSSIRCLSTQTPLGLSVYQQLQVSEWNVSFYLSRLPHRNRTWMCLCEACLPNINQY